MIKDFGFIQSLWETCISKEVSGSTIEFLMNICCWHIVDRKWCRISGKHIGLFEKCFSMKTWIKLLEHWASRSIRIDQKMLNSTFKWIHTVTRFWRSSKIDQQRRSSWLCYKVWVLSKTQDLTTAEERERTKVVSYALDVGSAVCCAAYRTWSVPSHELVKGYKCDLGMDHRTTVKVILSN